MRATARSLVHLPVLLLAVLAVRAAGAAAPPIVPPANPRVFDYDAKAPLDVRIVGSEKQPGVTLQSLTYASPKGGRVPGLLVVPDGKGPFAGMLFMHGAPGDHRRMIPEAETLARRGVVALLIDAPFARGSRAAEPLRFDESNRADQIQLIVDLRRGVDLLTSRPDVDPKRLGYLGISYGGAMGGLLAGVEKRVAAYALVVGDGGLVSHFSGPEVGDSPLQQQPPGLAERWLRAMEPIEPLRFVGRAAPAQLLFQNGRQDTLVPPSHARAYQQAGSEPKTILWYDAGHGLDPQAVHDRHEWLAAQLGIAHPAP
jgi:dienelactone hydrolase